jgi:3-deoxy-manno-octulosonate cytidylyltransferase (CMP-KDO synthetase)
VKVVFDKEGFALYFSRAPVPYYRDKWKNVANIQHSAFDIQNCYKHIGIYGYKRDILLSLAEMTPTKLEKIERLEQLRALENGIRIKVKETFFETYGVDTPEDIEKVEKCLSSSM